MKRRIAVVGAGVSGLTAAYLLHRTHDVTVFEAESRPGGHAHTVTVETGPDSHFVDLGFVVLNDRNYPMFTRLLARLGVSTQRSDMSMSVSSELDDFEYCSRSLNGLLAKRSHAVDRRFVRMIVDARRFQREAPRLLNKDQADTLSLRDYLEQGGFSAVFADRLLIPQASSIWSADPTRIPDVPARFLVQFFANHGLLGLRDRPRWYTVTGGSIAYVERMASLLRLRLGTPIEAIRRFDDRVEVTARGSAPMVFDEVVVATHSDQALAMLSDASVAERDVLGAVPYQHNEAVLHTDTRLLPRRRRAWSSWNYHCLETTPDRPTITYHMNRLQNLTANREFCVTLNRSEVINPASVIQAVAFHHPVFTPDGVAAQGRHGEISGVRRTHFAGAYWGWGFHEDGVKSGARVAAALGGEPL